jgi:hypothetical protein
MEPLQLEPELVERIPHVRLNFRHLWLTVFEVSPFIGRNAVILEWDVGVCKYEADRFGQESRVEVMQFVDGHFCNLNLYWFIQYKRLSRGGSLKNWSISSSYLWGLIKWTDWLGVRMEFLFIWCPSRVLTLQATHSLTQCAWLSLTFQGNEFRNCTRTDIGKVTFHISGGGPARYWSKNWTAAVKIPSSVVGRGWRGSRQRQASKQSMHCVRRNQSLEIRCQFKPKSGSKE